VGELSHVIKARAFAEHLTSEVFRKVNAKARKRLFLTPERFSAMAADFYARGYLARHEEHLAEEDRKHCLEMASKPPR
jgi:hypothetical protein